MRETIKLTYITCWMMALIAVLSSCDVHEWPEPVPITEREHRIILNFDTDMGEQEHFYDSRSTELIDDYEMRYVINAHPYSEPARTQNGARSISRAAMWSYTFTRPVQMNDYNCEISLKIPKGEYTLMVWADFVKKGTAENHFYNPSEFAEIVLHGEHKANTDFRDAFRGTQAVEIHTLAPGEEPADVVIPMKRPLAKFTVITTDLKEFFEREEEAARKLAESRGEEYNGRGISLDEYNVVFYYSGFMPCAYSMFTDKPIDSKTGVKFYSKLEQISEEEARMGFDFVMVNGTDASVMVTLGLLDADGNPVSMSDEINVPLNRSVNTIVRGKFLIQEANGGVGIDPSFDRDHNIEIK